MKKLIVILVTLITFSSKAQNNKDTVGSICVPYPIMKNIQTDLLVGDSAVAVLNVTSLEVKELKNKILFQMNEIDNYKLESDNLKTMNENIKKQMSLNESIVKTLKSDYTVLSKAYKRNKVRNTVVEILGFAAGIFITAEAIHYKNLYIKHM